MTRAGCWARARRKFVDAEASKPEVAKEAAELIGRLYAVEHEASGLDADNRLALRQAKSRPVLEALKDRLHAWRDELLPKHPMAQAAQYALNQWETLVVFAGDGAVPIDNNTAEREMKRMVREPQEQPLRRRPPRRAHRRHPHQYVPPPRHRPRRRGDLPDAAPHQTPRDES